MRLPWSIAPRDSSHDFRCAANRKAHCYCPRSPIDPLGSIRIGLYGNLCTQWTSLPRPSTFQLDTRPLNLHCYCVQRCTPIAALRQSSIDRQHSCRTNGRHNSSNLSWMRLPWSIAPRDSSHDFRCAANRKAHCYCPRSPIDPLGQ
jgi:hypothetical protein